MSSWHSDRNATKDGHLMSTDSSIIVYGLWTMDNGRLMAQLELFMALISQIHIHMLIFDGTRPSVSYSPRARSGGP
eukprot:scaffold246601_cov32-Tisochrysis_lutea.AAC.3